MDLTPRLVKILTYLLQAPSEPRRKYEVIQALRESGSGIHEDLTKLCEAGWAVKTKRSSNRVAFVLNAEMLPEIVAAVAGFVPASRNKGGRPGKTAAIRNPYAGNPSARASRASRRMVDEERIILRYTRDSLSMEDCARRFGTTPEIVKAILTEREVPIRGKTELDEAAVIRCYNRLGGAQNVSTVLSTSTERVVAILRKNGIEPTSGPDALRPYKERLLDKTPSPYEESLPRRDAAGKGDPASR